jgi:1-acyl-sn-glycerol-3-phosphate acyltransferase
MQFIYFAPLVLQTLVYPFTWIAFRFFTRIRIEGLEHVRGMKNGALFAVNHSSELNPILIPATLPFLSRLMPMFYVSREKAFYLSDTKKRLILRWIFYGGNIFKLWGAYPATVGTGDYDLALRHHIKILNNGRSVCIFPEGKITRDGLIGEGKPGVAYLLWRTGVPVVPVAIRGDYRISFREFLFRKRTITVSYGVPIASSGVFETALKEGRPPTLEELKNATNLIMARIRALWEA